MKLLGTVEALFKTAAVVLPFTVIFVKGMITVSWQLINPEDFGIIKPFDICFHDKT